VSRGLTDDARDAAMDEAMSREIGVAVDAVEAMPLPERATLFDDVYADLPWHLREQRDELAKVPPAPAHGA
jgi:pyruvate dehydrogenase E1 component alpha subunit/2-oxoisovalerate dehydrogenase E1 component alpha subunit